MEEQLYIIWLFTQLESLNEGDPRTINYKTGLTIRLHPEYTFVKGELTQVKYFSEYQNEDSLVVCVDIQWERNTNGDLLKRIETRKYVIDSESDDIVFGDFVKISEKFYDTVTAAKADTKRRQNIVNNLTAQAEQFGILPFVQTVWRNLDDELSAYIGTGDHSIISEITNYNGSWLEFPSSVPTFTLRQVIIAELTIS